MKTQRATLLRVQLVDIHGQHFYDLTFALESKPDKPQTSRLGTESVYPQPKEGDEVEVTLLLGQLTNVAKVKSSD